jgi:uncharacterized membrane protein YphA (DoxX/SURF4 family)
MTSLGAQESTSSPGSLALLDLALLDLVGLVCAGVLALIFVWAAVAKLRDRAATETDFASLGLPRPALLATAVPVAELSVAGLLAIVPGWGGVAAFGLLALFSAVLVGAVRSGSTASCACFGGGSRSQVSWAQVGRNAVLGLLALAAVPVSSTTATLLL